MKKIFIMLLAASTITVASAKDALTGTKFTDNWSIGLHAGVTQPLAHPYSIGDNIRPIVGVELYKQFTPVFKTGIASTRPEFTAFAASGPHSTIPTCPCLEDLT